MKISIILPTRNEELLIKSAVLDITNFLKRRRILSYELLIVVNGTTDNSIKIISDLALSNKKIRILKSLPGYGKALRRGLRVAKGRYVVIYNVDFYDLKMIDLVNIDLYGKDVIVGSKMAHWSFDGRTVFRKLISYMYNKYLKIMHKFNGSDTHGIKLIRQKVVKEILPQCKTDSGIFDTEFVLRAQYAGFKFADFPVEVFEKRPPRFTQRILNTPMDIYALHKALKTNE